VRRIALVIVALCGCSAVEIDSSAPAHVAPSIPARAPCDGKAGRCNDVYVVAHPDDDLLFMNPDIQTSIAHGNNVTVVVLTAGDQYDDDFMPSWAGKHERCGKPSHDDPELYWRDRERGLLNAYAYMAGQAYQAEYASPPGIPDSWTLVSDPGHVSISIDGLDVVQYRLSLACGEGCAEQSVSVMFFRLADRQLQCLWNNEPGCVNVGYRPEQAQPESLSSARAHCSIATAQSCQLDGECPHGETCVQPGQTPGTCLKEPAIACTSKASCNTDDPDDDCVGAGCSGCVMRTGTYSAFTMGCATAAVRTCAWKSGANTCAFPADGGDRCCTACSSETGADPCPLGTAIPEQVVVGRDRLVGILADLFVRLHADSVSMLDSTNLHFDVLGNPTEARDADNGYVEQWNHYFAGLFTTAAAVKAQAAIAGHLGLRVYRAYTINREPPNLSLSGAQQLAKKQVFARYLLFDNKFHFADGHGIDAPVSGYENYDATWADRMYATRTLVGPETLQGRLAVGADGCVGVSGKQPTLVDCGVAPAWQLTPSQQIRLAGTSRCLTVVSKGGHTVNPGLNGRTAPMADEQVVLAACAASPEATMFAFANGQIRTSGARCLQQSGGTIVSSDCKQSCMDATGNLAEDVFCRGEPQLAQFHVQGVPPPDQDWTLLFDAPRRVSPQLGDATEIPSSPSYYRTFSLAHGHVCVRRAEGVVCASYAGEHLAPATMMSSAYSDAAGWKDDANGSTVTSVWDPGGELIACGRGSAGVTCSSGLVTGDYSDAQGWRQAAYYFGSLRFVTLGAGISVCGLGADGILCDANTGSRFGAMHTWSRAFSAENGWGSDASGETIQFADVDNDGRIDVCGRSPLGLECAVQAGSTFVNEHLWSVRGDFSDADRGLQWAQSPAYFGSIQLVDINRDGFADVCGRGWDGIWCALSTGNGFERKKLVEPSGFTDLLGWGVPARGSTIRFGDLDGDARVDVCGRDAGGVMCAAGY
jgi:hypothetical protein